jgi:hypothetical protein
MDINRSETNAKLLFLGNLRSALAGLPRWERGFIVFWLLGPFILLIERSPADAWLTVLALAFVVRAIVKRDGSFFRAFWVKATFGFWGVCLLSSATSSLPVYSLGEAFIWIRFPIFAMASIYWLGKDKNLLYAMLISTAIAMMIMTTILLVEYFIEGHYLHQGRRLTWPYGDKVPGNYLAKVSLPVFTAMAAVALSSYKNFRGWATFLLLITIAASIFTGERINFLLRLSAGFLAGLVWRPSLYRYGALSLLLTAAIVVSVTIMPQIGERYISSFLNDIPIYKESHYYQTMSGALFAYEQEPLLGIGTGNYRFLCGEVAPHLASNGCNTHPHNYYLQLLGETGIIGLFFGSVMLISIVWFCFITRTQDRVSVLAATAFIVPLGLFFPIQSTADFFGQWNNIFMWSAIGLALATRNLVAVDMKSSKEK